MEFLHNAQVYSSHLHCPPLKLSAPLCFPHPSKPRVYHFKGPLEKQQILNLLDLQFLARKLFPFATIVRLAIFYVILT